MLFAFKGSSIERGGFAISWIAAGYAAAAYPYTDEMLSYCCRKPAPSGETFLQCCGKLEPSRETSARCCRKLAPGGETSPQCYGKVEPPNATSPHCYGWFSCFADFYTDFNTLTSNNHSYHNQTKKGNYSPSSIHHYCRRFHRFAQI